MNQGIIISIIAILLCFYAAFSQSKWIDRGEYKELATPNQIAKLGFPLGDSVICIFDYALKYKKFDLNGNLILEMQLSPRAKVKYFGTSSDVSTYADIADSSIYHEVVGDIILRNIETDSILYHDKKFMGFWYSGGTGTFEGAYFDYINKSREAFVALNASTSNRQTYHNKANWYLGAIMQIIDTSSGLFSNWACTNFDLNEHYTLFSTKYDYWNADYNGSQYVTKNDEKRTQFLIIDKVHGICTTISDSYLNGIDPSKNKPGYIPNKVKLGNRTNLFISNVDNYVVFHRLDSNKASTIDMLTLDYKPNIMLFSMDDKFLIFGTPNHSIEIYEFSTKNKILTYQLNDGYNANAITLTSDGSKMYAGCGNGTIKLFEPRIFSNGLKAFFTVPSRVAYIGSQIHFQDYSRGNPDKWYWDFGDGTTSTEQNPIHSYNSIRKYTVKLIVWKGNISDTLEIPDYITILTTLKAGFSANPLTGNTFLKVNFNDESTGDIIYHHWDFGDGDTSNIMNPEHIYQKSGNYYVRLIVSDGGNHDTLIKNNYISIKYYKISDPIFDFDKIINSDNESIKGTTGFESTDGSFFAEGLIGNKSMIYKLDKNLDTVWTMEQVVNKFYKPIQGTKEGNIIAIGASSPDNTDIYIKQINKDRNIVRTKIFNDSTKQNDIFSYIVTKDGYGKLSKLIGSQTHLLYIKYNFWDSLIYNGNYGYIEWEQGYIYDAILALRPDSIVVALSNAMYNSYSDGLCYSTYLKQFPINVNGWSLKSDKKTIISDFKFIKDSLFAYIEDYSRLTLALQNVEVKWQKTFPKTTLNSICRLTDTTFAVAGSKEGYCWFGFIDLAGNIKQEYQINERLGEFAKANLCKDGSLLLTGSVYKNKDENSLYLFKTTQVVVLDTSPIITMPGSFELNVFYNSSGKNINFNIDIPEPGNVMIEVYDILGRLAGKTGGWVNSSGEFSVYCGNFPGLLIYRVIAGNNILTGKIIAVP